MPIPMPRPDRDHIPLVFGRAPVPPLGGTAPIGAEAGASKSATAPLAGRNLP